MSKTVIFILFLLHTWQEPRKTAWFFFCFDWEQRKLGELTSIKTGKLDANAAKENGLYAFFTCGKEALRTNTYSFEGDAIIISGNGDLGFTRKYSGKFDAYQRTYVLQDFLVDYEYLECAIHRYLPERIKGESFGGAMPYIKLNTLTEMEIAMPKQDEANLISSFLCNLDNLITLHQRKQKSVFSLGPKQKRVQKMTNAWEQRKLGDFFVERNERSEEGELISVTIGSGIQKYADLGRFDTKPSDMSNYKKVEVGDIAYNSMRMWQGASGFSPYSGILSPAYTVICPREGVSSLFFSYLIKRYQMIHLFQINSQGLTPDTWNLKYPAFSLIEAGAPKERDEQDKIADILCKIDNLITLHQRKCDALFYPATTEKTRFLDSSNNYAWEQRKLGEIAKAVTRNEPTSDAPIMMITANNGFIEQSERYAFDNAGESLKKYILLEKGELAYNHGASKMRPYGSCFALTTVEKARIPFVYHCFSVGQHDSEFVSIELNGAEIEKQLRRIVSSGARMDGLLNISFDEYTSIEVLLPIFEEQHKIATCFRTLDNLITLHQCE